MEDGGLEREVKLDAGFGFRIPELDGLAAAVTARPQPEQHLHAVYVDTPDLRLARNGLTLRHRSERLPSSAPGEWTFKLPEPSTEPGLSRRELNWPGRFGPIPAEVSGLLRGYRRTAALGPVARLVTHRRRTILAGRDGEPLLEIDDDVVSVMDARRLAARFREVEVEVLGGASAALLDAVLARLGEAGAVRGDARPKLVRALGLRATEPPDVVPVVVGRAASMGEAVRAAIAQGYLRLLAHDLGVRLDEDPEDVHLARVATRRLRSDLRTFRAFLPEDWAQETRRELGWLAEALGRARDADVLLARLHREVESLDSRDAAAAGALIGALIASRDQARDHLLEVMVSDRYGELLDRLVAAARELPPMKQPADPVLADPVLTSTALAITASAAAAVIPVEAPMSAGEPHLVVEEPAADRDAPARRLAPSVVNGPWRHVARAVAALDPEPTDEALHEVRIRAKRLRYACEAVAGVIGKPATDLARAAADLQGVLGDFHDAIVAAEWLRAGAASPTATPAEALAAGQVIVRERQEAARCRAAWPASWKRLDRKKLRAWLH
ncbi:MAG TPA: CYTH and CHAD domain-containing protein [Acidimicrobiales bacterium]